MTDPTFLKSHEKWDHAIENMLRKTTTGLALGVLPALALGRTAAARFGILFFFVGAGSGIAYREARYLFDHNIAFDNRYLVQLRLTPPPAVEKSPSSE